MILHQALRVQHLHELYLVPYHPDQGLALLADPDAQLVELLRREDLLSPEVPHLVDLGELAVADLLEDLVFRLKVRLQKQLLQLGYSLPVELIVRREYRLLFVIFHSCFLARETICYMPLLSCFLVHSSPLLFYDLFLSCFLADLSHSLFSGLFLSNVLVYSTLVCYSSPCDLVCTTS